MVGEVFGVIRPGLMGINEIQWIFGKIKGVKSTYRGARRKDVRENPSKEEKLIRQKKRYKFTAN